MESREKDRFQFFIKQIKKSVFVFFKDYIMCMILEIVGATAGRALYFINRSQIES
jgi:hypothetical protein